jgi:hypothetical protein
MDVKTGGKNPSLSYYTVLIVGNPRGVVTTVEEASDAGTKKWAGLGLHSTGENQMFTHWIQQRQQLSLSFVDTVPWWSMSRFLLH